MLIKARAKSANVVISEVQPFFNELILQDRVPLILEVEKDQSIVFEHFKYDEDKIDEEKDRLCHYHEYANMLLLICFVSISLAKPRNSQQLYHGLVK